MTDPTTIVTIIAATGLIITVIRAQGKATDQRLDDFRNSTDQRFKDFGGSVDAKLEAIRVAIHADIENLRVEVRQVKERIAQPPIFRP